MANNSNTCAHLEINDEYQKIVIDQNEDGLKNLFELQRNIQEKVYGYDFDSMDTLGKIKTFIDWNIRAFSDETSEMYDALGGINSDSSAIWKPWKKNHISANNKKFTDLSDDEIKELKFEYIDMFHFFINIGLALKITPEEIFNMYHSKNLENKRRQRDGY